MNDEQKDIIIFTGQSGIKVKSCMKKLAGTGLVFQPVAIDEYMTKVSGKKFVEVLGMPPRIQESLWSKAFERVRNTVLLQSKRDKYTFLTFHASYFYQRKTEFVCPVDLGKLLQLSDRTKMVIVLLDDCYDIYRRLMGEGQMYEDIWKLEPREALLQSILNLISILTWRESEIAFSRKIAQLLDAPLYTVAVKHPSFMISRLISTSPKALKILYLSHPISAIRRKGAYPRLPDFYAELSRFIQDMLRFDNIVLFVPDTIDEYRISQKEEAGNRYIPELLNGWPLPNSDKWLYEPLPSKLSHVNPLNPRGFDFHAASAESQSTISSMLRVLSEKIRDQINSRDRTLVEQSRDGIVVFRPYWAASTPPGVEQEMMYNFDLGDRYGEKERETYMLITCEDLGKWRIKELFTLVENSVNIANKEDLENLQSLCLKWSSDAKMLSEFYNNSYDKTRLREELETILPQNYEFSELLVSTRKSALDVGKMLHKAERRERGWAEIFEQMAQEDPLSTYTTEGCGLLCQQDKFEQECKNFVRNVIARKTGKGKKKKGG